MCQVGSNNKAVPYREANYILAHIHERRFFQRICLLIPSLFREDLNLVYESVQAILKECCLCDKNQMEQVNKVRAICKAETEACSTINTVSMGLIAALISLFGVACSLIGNIFKELIPDTISIIYNVIIVLILIGVIYIVNIYKQNRSSVIVSAIDDTLAKFAQSQAVSANLGAQENENSQEKAVVKTIVVDIVIPEDGQHR